METFTLAVWLVAGSAAPVAEFPGLTEYQCEHWRAELRKEWPHAVSSCEPDRAKRQAVPPVARFWD